LADAFVFLGLLTDDFAAASVTALDGKIANHEVQGVQK